MKNNLFSYFKTIKILSINIYKVIFWRLKYGSNIKVSILQSFGKGCSIEIIGISKIVIGKNCSSRKLLQLIASNGNIILGDNCFFNTNCSITSLEKVTIGNNCTFGNNVVIVDHDHDYASEQSGNFISKEIIIGDNVWVGANSVILKGTIIGNNSVIAAGSIVKNNIPKRTLYYQKREIAKRDISNEKKQERDKQIW